MQTIKSIENRPGFHLHGISQLLQEGAVLLDVRTHCEHAGYHMEGAINIPYDEIARLIDLIKKWEKPVITFSAHGRRSDIAAKKLKAFGVEAYDGGTVENILSEIRPMSIDYHLDES